MKSLRYIVLLAAWTLITSVSAQNNVPPSTYALTSDSVYLYTTWEHVFDEAPDTMIVNPTITIESYTEFDFEPEGHDKKAVKKFMEQQVAAVAVGDTLWYASTKWLRRNFKDVARYISGYVPLYFNSKIVFISCIKPVRSYGPSLFDIFFGNAYEEESGFGDEPAAYFWLDFEGKRLREVDSDELSRLMEHYGYRDLQMRYEAMRDYRETYMVNDFFVQLVTRLASDPTVPFLF